MCTLFFCVLYVPPFTWAVWGVHCLAHAKRHKEMGIKKNLRVGAAPKGSRGALRVRYGGIKNRKRKKPQGRRKEENGKGSVALSR